MLVLVLAWVETAGQATNPSIFQTPFVQTALPIMFSILIAVIVNNKAYDTTNKRFGDVSGRFNDLNGRLNDLTHAMKQRFTELSADVDRRLDEQRGDMNHRFDDVIKRLDNIANKLDNHENRIIKLEAETSLVKR